MRTYDKIINEYLEWYSIKSCDDSYLPLNFLNCLEKEVKIKKAAIWKTILDLCYKDKEGIYWFSKFILGDMTYAGYPSPIRFNRLWWKWTKIMYKGKRIAIKCPRQHGKSTFWTVINTVYRASLFENYNILIASASEDQAIYFLGYVSGLIENNEFLVSKRSQHAKWSSTELKYNGGIIKACGVGSEVRGKTYDYVLCDDILRSDNKLSETDIEKFITEELTPMLFVRRGQLVIVGTPKSETDIFSSIQQKIDDGTSWQLFEYDSIVNWDKKEVLCPDRFTWEQLMEERKSMGRLQFDKEFRCRTYSSGSQLFPMKIRRSSIEMGQPYSLYERANMEETHKISYYAGVDVARAGTASADFTVVIVLAYDPETKTKRIVWMWRSKGMKIARQVEEMAKISQDFNHPIFLVEKNNMGQELIDQMTDDYGLTVESYTTGGTRAKEDLIRGLITAFENNKIIVPYKDEETREKMDILNHELDRFIVEKTPAGNEKFKGSGRTHDDCVDALALANRCSQAMGYSACATSFDRMPKSYTELEQYATNNNIDELIRM